MPYIALYWLLGVQMELLPSLCRSQMLRSSLPVPCGEPITHFSQVPQLQL